MGAKQSRRSVDITTTPKKEGIPADGGVVLGDAAAPGDGKLERIEENDAKPTTNGIAPHTDATEDKDKDKDDATEKEKEKQEEVKAEDAKQLSAEESAAETAEVTTPTEATPASPNAATSPDVKETKKKDKVKKKWSFRSISFSKKDKSKPAREEAPKNGDVTKEEPLAEGGEEAENVSATAASPVEEKSVASSPSAENESVSVSATATATPTATPTATATTTTTATTPSTETKEDGPTVDAGSPADEKQEEPTPSAPTPVPVEEKKEEVEKVEAEKKVVEVSPAGGQFVPEPVDGSIFRVQTVATPSIIERKTSEDTPSLPPSSPPPTPIDPTPLQQAQQAAATATALAEALKLPAEAAEADKNVIAPPTDALSSTSSCPKLNDTSSIPPAEPLDVFPQRPPGSPTDRSRTESTPPVLPELNAPPVVDENLICSNVGLTATLESRNTDKTEGPVTETRSETVNSEKTCEIADHKMIIEPVSEPVISNKVEIVQASPESNLTHDIVGIHVEAEVECTGENTPDEELLAEIVEPDQVVREGTKPIQEIVLDPSISVSDSFVNSEEGPVPLSEEEIVVEAKPAVVIPEDDEIVEKEVTETDADHFKVNTESVQAIGNVEEVLVSEAEDKIFVVSEGSKNVTPSAPTPDDSLQPGSESIRIVCALVENTLDKVAEIIAESKESIPLVSESEPEANLGEKLDSENTSVQDDSIVTPSPVDVDVREEPSETVERMRESERPSSPQTERIESSSERYSLFDVPPVSPTDASLEISSGRSIDVEKDSCPEIRSPPHTSPSRLENVPTHDDIPRESSCVDSFEYPLPPEELPCPLIADIDRSETNNDVPVPIQNASILRNPTEALLTPPRSPSPRTTDSITSGLTTSTKDSSRTQFHDDQSNREFKMESVSISLDSYNESDIELKERLAESLAETMHQEESSISCQLSNNATSSTTVQETHQSIVEPEAPVENNVVRDNTMESSEETKITPAAIPTEVPASPPSAPAITEDVASVAKAIEEIDISDKAVAAATIECNTNAIIADAHYQNNINE